MARDRLGRVNGPDHGAAPPNQPSTARESVASVIEDILGCKWTLHILGQIRHGVIRPGALQRNVPGLTTKVMNERLRKLVRHGLLEKRAYPERPLRVEYRLTPFGRRTTRILDQIEALDREHSTRA